MQELISPSQSEILVLVLAFLLLIGASIYGYKTAGKRGLVAGIVGPCVYLLWQVHKYATRYDPKTGYFGLQSLAVLLVEVAVFVLIGAVIARIWDGVVAKSSAESQTEA